MQRLIENLGIAIITFILGLFALDLWTALHPPKLAYPKQVVLIKKQTEEVSKKAEANRRCYEDRVPAFLDFKGPTYCTGFESKPNCQ